MFPASRTLRASSVVARRHASYLLPTIPVLETLRSTDKDFGGLYSNKILNEVWFQRGQHIVDRLNSKLEEKKVSNPPADLNELIAATFGKPELAQVCSYASMLHNLQFCLESLAPSETDSFSGEKPTASALLQTPSIATKFANEPKDELREWIEDSFGSLAEFRTLLLNSAAGIKGDGVTWLVAQASYAESSLRDAGDVSYNTLAVMNTYNAGIVDDSIRSGQVTKLRQQQAAKEEAVRRKNEERREIEGAAAEEEAPRQQNDLVLGTVAEAEDALLFSDRKLVPLLAVDASMRAYLGDYGVFGKQQYLNNVWDRVNWDVVARRAPRRFKPSVVFDQ